VAGRPIRRARLERESRSNPLLSYTVDEQNEYPDQNYLSFTPPELFRNMTHPGRRPDQKLPRALVITRSSGAPRLFARAYKNVPLDINILITGKTQYIPPHASKPGPPLSPGEAPRPLYLEIGSHNPTSLDGPHGTPLRFAAYTPFTVLHRFGDTLTLLRSTTLDGPRGTPLRFAAYTPFTVLHRFGDTLTLLRYGMHAAVELQRGHIPYATVPIPEGYKGGEWRVMASTGVDTWAGRNLALNGFTDALSDLFAKFLYTGRIAYDVEALPPSGNNWFPNEMAVRREFDAFARKRIPEMFAMAQRGGYYGIH